MKKTEEGGERNGSVLALSAVLGVLCAGCLACAVLAMVKAQWAAGVFCIVAALLLVWALIGFLRLFELYAAFEKHFRAREFGECERYARAIAEAKLFYPIMRFTGLRVMLLLSMAADRLNEARGYIERIRHGGGEGWKFRTAYYYILILLDEGDGENARTEFEEFRARNAEVPYYRSQLEVLDALFSRLFYHSDEPLPQSAIDSPFPVVQRILGKHYERRALERSAEWN